MKGAVQSGRLGFRLDGAGVAGIDRRTSDIIGNASSRLRFANRRALLFFATLMGMDAENGNICKSIGPIGSRNFTRRPDSCQR